ncbi:MAG: hypothetical protein LQ341_005199 [Variospora aurantia]|nr:MAG: hypothetical protein LQ341_005199 [Variospora aurantia]
MSAPSRLIYYLVEGILILFAFDLSCELVCKDQIDLQKLDHIELITVFLISIVLVERCWRAASALVKYFLFLLLTPLPRARIDQNIQQQQHQHQHAQAAHPARRPSQQSPSDVAEHETSEQRDNSSNTVASSSSHRNEVTIQPEAALPRLEVDEVSDFMMDLDPYFTRASMPQPIEVSQRGYSAAQELMEPRTAGSELSVSTVGAQPSNRILKSGTPLLPGPTLIPNKLATDRRREKPSSMVSASTKDWYMPPPPDHHGSRFIASILEPSSSTTTKVDLKRKE